MFWYLDLDVAYLLGLLVARGRLIEDKGTYNVILAFPKAALQATGSVHQFDGEREVRLELERVRRRVWSVLGGDVGIEDGGDSWRLVVRLFMPTVSWRNLRALLNDRTGYEYFEIPEVLMHPDTPRDYKLEFIRGFADVAGNIRLANRDREGRHRVRLDVLNYKTNWKLPVQLCQLLQDHLDVGVSSIIWGHPNMGRAWREHQINIYADEFEKVGFSFGFKQQVLIELAELNRAKGPALTSRCPGERRRSGTKPRNREEKNQERLPQELMRRHFDAYWEICRALGCPKRPDLGQWLAPESDA